MTPFAFNIVLAVIWAVLIGRVDLFNFLVGMGFGALALFLSRGIWGGAGYFRRIGRTLSLIAWSVLELVSAAFIEALSAFRIGRAPETVRIEVPLTIDRDAEIAVLSSLISLSPGTLVLGLTSDRARLIVRTSAKRRNEIEARIKRRFERHILEVMR
ncbi:MAG: Na+/H+ antiporter subunit E [Alphaproteobacteria bacterium]